MRERERTRKRNIHPPPSLSPHSHHPHSPFILIGKGRIMSDVGEALRNQNEAMSMQTGSADSVHQDILSQSIMSWCEIQNTQEIKRTLFNWTKRNKTCTFSRKSSFSSQVQNKNKQFIQFISCQQVRRLAEGFARIFPFGQSPNF